LMSRKSTRSGEFEAVATMIPALKQFCRLLFR